MSRERPGPPETRRPPSLVAGAFRDRFAASFSACANPTPPPCDGCGDGCGERAYAWRDDMPARARPVNGKSAAASAGGRHAHAVVALDAGLEHLVARPRPPVGREDLDLLRAV